MLSSNAGKLPFYRTARPHAFLSAVFIAIIFSVSGCKKPEYPVTYSLTDPKDGKSIPVRITGRTTTHVEFIRQKDSKFFSYPLNKLSSKDRKFVARLPVAKTDDKIVPPIAKNNPPYIQSRLEQMARLEKGIFRLKREIEDEAGNPGMIKHHQKQISSKLKEILELQQDIERYRSEHK